MTDSLMAHVREELEEKFKKDQKEAEEKLASLQKELKSKSEEAEAAIKKKEEELKSELNKKWLEKQDELKKKIEEEAKSKLNVELKDLKSQFEEKEKQLEEAEKRELEFRKKQREIEEKSKKLELEMQRKLDKEREKLSESAKKQALEEQKLKIAEKDKQLDMMKKQIEDLKRKSEQGSMQIQGEVQEEDLKNMISSQFPLDDVSDVPTGINGADLIQTVKNQLGKKSGVILWESKNTKTFSSKWISKLKDDRLKVKADICILVTQALPDDVDSFGLVDGVWVCDYNSFIQLAFVLRQNLNSLTQVKNSLMGQDEKMNILYKYLSGPQFRSRVENIVGTFTVMKDDLEKEKRVMKKHWAKREQEIERIIDNTVGMHGDLQGILGKELPGVEALELDDEESLELGV